MNNSARDITVLAFADHLCADPEMLRAWTAAFSDADAITLLIHPGRLAENEIDDALRTAMTSAAMADDCSADLLALSRVPKHEEALQIVQRCSAVYARTTPQAPFDQLHRVDVDSVTSLRDQVLEHHATSGSRGVTPRRQVMTINGAWDLFHRGTQADLGVIQQIFVDDAYSLHSFERWPGLRRYADGSLNGRPLIVDCGANIGASSMYFSIAYPQASVVALEPEAGNFQLLRENTAVFPGVKPLHNAVASKRSTLVISDPGIGEWGYRTGASGDGGRSIGSVEAIPIEDVMDVAGDAIPFILKIDIEGAEGDLFSRHAEAFAQFPVVIVELHDWMLPGERTSEPFLHWHLSQGRDFVHRGENIFSLARSLCVDEPSRQSPASELDRPRRGPGDPGTQPAAPAE